MPDSTTEPPEGRPEPVEIAGLLLDFEVVGEIVTVTDADSGAWVGNAFALTRAEGPLFHPCWAYREQLGTRPDDPRGSDARDQIANHAKEVHHARTEG